MWTHRQTPNPWTGLVESPRKPQAHNERRHKGYTSLAPQENEPQPCWSTRDGCLMQIRKQITVPEDWEGTNPLSCDPPESQNMPLNPGWGAWAPLCSHYGTHFVPKISKRLLRLSLLSPEEGFTHTGILGMKKPVTNVLWLPWHPCLPRCAPSSHFPWLVPALFFHNQQLWGNSRKRRIRTQTIKLHF